MITLNNLVNKFIFCTYSLSYFCWFFAGEQNKYATKKHVPFWFYIDEKIAGKAFKAGSVGGTRV